MKELPILFSTPMVKAILENRKTMTRRTHGLERINDFVQKGHTFRYDSIEDGPDEDRYVWFEEIGQDGNPTEIYRSAKPQYQIGDHLWTRETFFDARKWKHAPLFADGPDFIYKADEDAFIGCHNWQPSLFMPKDAARIWLECTGVRCERLMNISEEDAFAEGIEWKIKYPEECPDTKYYKDYSVKKKERYAFGYAFGAVNSFITLWDSINGSGSHNLSPWVFVYKFKRIERP